ncbi:MAG: family 10 glycosylhydrolase [Candidatus Helarchaeota archaeon]
MDVGIYLFPQYFKNGDFESLFKLFSQNSINQIHVSFNENYVLKESFGKDLLFFKPERKYYKNDNQILNFSSDYDKIIRNIVETAKRFNLKIIAWLNCLKRPYIVKIHPDWAQVNYKGVQNHEYLCPNNPNVQDYISSLITNIIEKYSIGGLELFNARFPSPYKEDFCCFCESCKKDAANPRAFEDLKEREIINNSAKGVNIKPVKKYFVNKSELLELESLEQDLIFQRWNQFRLNSITRFVGKVLVAARKINQNISVGTDIWPISKAELMGQNHADLATYQDLIYQNLFIDTTEIFQKFSRVIKEINDLKKLIKKGRGLTKFYTSINIHLPIKTTEITKLFSTLHEMKLRGLVLYYYKEEKQDMIIKISKILKDSKNK